MGYWTILIILLVQALVIRGQFRKRKTRANERRRRAELGTLGADVRRLTEQDSAERRTRGEESGLRPTQGDE